MPYLTKQCETRCEWLAEKREFLGASDTPVLFGFGYAGSSKGSIYADKVSGYVDRKPSEAMVLGSNCELGVIATARQLLGLEIVPRAWRIYRSTSHPFVGCSLDGELQDQETGGIVPVEVKNLSPWGVRELDEGPLPLKYQLQLQHQMFVVDAPQALFVANLANEGLYHKWEPRNDEFLRDTLLPALADFWARIERRDCPVDGDPEAYGDVLDRIFPRERPQAVVLADAYVDGNGETRSVLEILARRDKADALAKAAKAEKATCDNLLKVQMGTHQAAILPDGRYASWKTIERDGYMVAPTSYAQFSVVKSAPKGVTLA